MTRRFVFTRPRKRGKRAVQPRAVEGYVLAYLWVA